LIATDFFTQSDYSDGELNESANYVKCIATGFNHLRIAFLPVG